MKKSDKYIYTHLNLMHKLFKSHILTQNHIKIILFVLFLFLLLCICVYAQLCTFFFYKVS